MHVCIIRVYVHRKSTIRKKIFYQFIYLPNCYKTDISPDIYTQNVTTFYKFSLRVSNYAHVCYVIAYEFLIF